MLTPTPLRLTGLVAATYTPLDAAGDLDLSIVPDMVEHLLGSGIAGLFTCGSTGEGMSLTTAERMSVTAAYVAAASGRVPIIAHVGHS